MNLFTKIDIPAANWQIDFTKKIVFWGSCFAENISARFTEHKFSVLANPFGTVYNPLSIERQLKHIADGKIFDENDVFQDIRRDNGHGDNLWHCWDAHSSLSEPTREECIQKLNRVAAQAREFLQQTDVVFITIGSAFIYSLDGTVVANCHRQDPKIFERRLISVDEAAQAIHGIVENLRKIISGSTPNIVFTVSPIRHKGDGAHGTTFPRQRYCSPSKKPCKSFHHLQLLAPAHPIFPVTKS